MTTDIYLDENLISVLAIVDCNNLSGTDIVAGVLKNIKIKMSGEQILLHYFSRFDPAARPVYNHSTSAQVAISLQINQLNYVVSIYYLCQGTYIVYSPEILLSYS